MNKKLRIIPIILLVALGLGLAYYYFSHHTVAVLEPRGPIALKERNLLLLAAGLMLIVVIPVFLITFYIVYKYRDGHKGKYKPDFDHSRILEITWWLIPGILITVLSVITWNATHALDPFKAIASNQTPLNIEVVALDWKWLFIYPQQNVASVNLVDIPVNHPINFYITADSPMNSFWIPQLSGQIYAMAGMGTQLHLMATSTGDYYGSSANISGDGFASMHFTARASTISDFKSWVNNAAKSKTHLTMAMYNQLSQPSSNNPVSYYSKPAANLYGSVINKYMGPGDQMNGMAGMN